MQNIYDNKTEDTNLHLDDFPFNSNYLRINEYNTHFIDEGPADATPVLLLHGVPTWSYLFRNVISVLLKNGFRVVAPDLIGFGRSDKPREKEFYTFDRLTNHLALFIEKLNLNNIVLFGHDWGALFGLRLAVENNTIFSGLIISNGLIPRGNEKIPYLFNVWKIITKYSPVLPIGKFIDIACNTKLTKKEKNAYNIPFNSTKDKIAVRLLPQLLPFKFNSPDFITAKIIWEELEKWEKPLLTLFSDNDSITRGGDKILQKHIPGSKGQNHKVLKGGHFIPEDVAEEIGESINQFVKTL